jgi:hypothetical protein
MSGLQNLGDDEWPLPGRSKLVAPSGVLPQPKHQVSHLEVSGPNPSGVVVKGKCALGPFLSILVIECQLKCLKCEFMQWMNKVQIKSKGMFLSLSTLVLCTNILV